MTTPVTNKSGSATPRSAKAGYIYNMSNQQTREEEHISGMSSDDTPHLRSQNGECVCMTGFRSSKRGTQMRERKRLPSWSPTLNIADYRDKYFGSFVWEGIESKGHGTLVNAQSFFGFLTTAWTKVGTPSSDQLISASITFDSNVRATPVRENGGRAE